MNKRKYTKCYFKYISSTPSLLDWMQFDEDLKLSIIDKPWQIPDKAVRCGDYIISSCKDSLGNSVSRKVSYHNGTWFDIGVVTNDEIIIESGTIPNWMNDEVYKFFISNKRLFKLLNRYGMRLMSAYIDKINNDRVSKELKLLELSIKLNFLKNS